MLPLLIALVAGLALTAAQASKKKPAPAPGPGSGSASSPPFLPPLGRPLSAPPLDQALELACLDPAMPQAMRPEAKSLLLVTPESLGKMPLELANEIDLAANSAKLNGFFQFEACLRAKSAALRLGKSGLPTVTKLGARF